jgi:hypothetical protein
MADLDKIAGQVAEVAQRVADVLDAARGKGARVGAGSSAARLLVLPSLNSRGFPPDLRGGLGVPAGIDDDLRMRENGDLYSHLLDRAERRRRRRETAA